MMSPDTLPNYHFLLIAPNLGAEWLFDAARRYWDRFRPTVISDLELVRLVPPDFTIAVTAIVRRDLAAQLRAELAEFRPDALFDPVVHDFFEDARLTLNGRADLNQPFGVPLAVTVVPADTTPVVPTPGPLPTGGPSPTPTAPGFITQTPTSGPPGPVYPTPGPITGDS